MNNEETIFKIKLYREKMENLFNHVLSMMENNPKYVFSGACSANLDLYFYYMDKIYKLKINQK